MTAGSPAEETGAPATTGANSAPAGGEPGAAPRAGRGRAATAAAYALVLVLAVENAVVGGFLVPLRVSGTLVPVALLLGGVVTALIGRAGGRVLRDRRGAIPPGAVALVLALLLGSRRTEGDLVLAGGDGTGLATVSLLYLCAVAVGAAAGYALSPVRPASPRPLAAPRSSSTSPEGGSGR